MSAARALPTLRWGIVATGMISSWFVHDLTLARHDAKARHVVQAIGSSSRDKGAAFAETFIPPSVPPPQVYGSYAQVYADPDVDIVYIGTPHGFHRQNCLDAIAAGKHVLCEKAFAMTAQEAREVFAAARARGVFVMEALRTRFFPLTQTLLRMVHEDKVIGDVRRVFCDLGLDMDITQLGDDSRLKNPALGAGSLLDIGVYSLTWGRMILDPNRGAASARPRMVALQSLADSVDMATSMLLHYPPTGGHGILTCTTLSRTPSTFCRIEGAAGFITVEGESASKPAAFTVYPKIQEDGKTPKGQTYSFDVPGNGLFWEADAVALDIAEGRTENEVMPWEETMRIMELMDEAKRQGAAEFP